MKRAPDKKHKDAESNRRAFIGRSAALAATAMLAPRALAQQSGPDPAPARPGVRPSAFEFDEISLSELSEGINGGRWSARRVVESYLKRIQDVDRDGPRINAILEINPDALAIADALDAELKAKGPRGPLHGVPIVIKDNIGTSDKMHTSAGSLALAGSFAPRDAAVVASLRSAGCILLGKSNMSEWANARGRAAVGGWSGRGGLTRNPYALDRSSGGSSSGTAAAVAANFAAASIGTETMGSIMSPAAMCGIVGLKPTVGLVSRSGVIPVSITQDSVGPMARSVRDAAILLSAMAGVDRADPATAEAARHVQKDYTASLDRDGLKGARIGVVRNLFGISYAADRVIERALEAIRGAGAIIVDPVTIDTVDAIWSFNAEVISYELKAGMNEYLAKLPGSKIKNLADLIRYNETHAEREMRWFGQETFQYAQQKGPLSSPEYQHALAMVRTLARDQGIDATMKEHSLDALIAPTQSPAWLSDMLLGDNGDVGAFMTSCAAGYPSITVPAGDVAGLPVGAMLFAGAWSEPKLLRYAYALEQILQARRPPLFLPTIEVRP